MSKIMNQVIWLRNETKEFERRTPLTPRGAKELLNLGAKVVIEEDENRVFPIENYRDVGCEIQSPGSWKLQAPKQAYILGLKELEDEKLPLSRNHIYFAHAFKGQEEAKNVLSRFEQGGGKLFDLEFLLNESNQRVAAFGFWAGYVGSAISLDYFFHQELFEVPYPSLTHFKDKQALIDHIREKMEYTEVRPKGIVIGAKGRCGSGAQAVFDQLGLQCTGWDYEQTQKGGPFKEITEHEIFINCVLLTKKIPPFINKEIINSHQKLKVIGDVSCDPNNPNNPIPLYDKITSWQDPFTKVEVNNS